MAQGPLKYAKRYNICYVDGKKFHTKKHATREATDNSGVCVKAANDSQDGDNFYGRLKVEYPAMPIKRVTLFKFHWYDLTRHGRGTGTRVHKRYQIVDIHIDQSYGKYDQFVLASQANQVYYMPYASLRRDLRDWRVVCKVRPKKYQVSVAIPNDVDDSAFQEERRIQFQVSYEDNVETSLRDPYG